MKKISSIVLLVVILLVIAGGGYFFSKYKAIDIPNDESGSITDSDPLPFTVPPGFAMSVFADGITGARDMEFGPHGVMIVSQTSEGKVVALPNTNGDQKADTAVIVVEGLDKPHGLAFRCTIIDSAVGNGPCILYVAESGQLSQFDFDPTTYKATNKKKLLTLPEGGTHFTRSLLFLPSPQQNLLLISIGSSCNVCREEDDNRASIIAYDVVKGTSEKYATGLRNSVFLDLHPVTGAVWATEMGRDGLGDTIPPDEINIIEKGKFYGWPICYGQNNHDTDFDKNTYIRNPCMSPFETPSKIDIPAHSAPLGLAFIPEEGWAEEYWYDALVAYHGSWNRSEPTGYKVVRIPLNAQGTASSTAPIQDFITGWLRPDGSKIGRPVDIKVMPGGTIYISDDTAGKIYVATRTR